jgi:hypothetical protein
MRRRQRRRTAVEDIPVADARAEDRDVRFAKMFKIFNLFDDLQPIRLKIAPDFNRRFP